ncbi:MAG TPA: glycine-rich protein, partial [Bacteroidia bacterium]|nr:glycine-rich protein [Bacteroidia bacterium]
MNSLIKNKAAALAASFKWHLLVAFFSFWALGVTDAQAQCPCAATNFSTISVAGWAVGQTATITTCIYGGERSTINNTVAGAVYRISTCGATYDTQLSIYTTGCAFLAYNDDNGPSCSGLQASVDVTSPGGSLYAVMNQYYCTTNTTCTSLYITLISMPVSPCATPTSVTANPSTICAGGSTNLSAISTGNTINWYTVSSGGAPIGSSASGANFSVSPASTTTYWAEAYNAGGSGGSQTFNYSGSIQNFVVPTGVTSITIQALGAQGGSSSGTLGGLGASITGTVAVTPGQVLKVLVGGQGAAGTQGGGGGGSFVTTNANAPLVIAGGGGGAYYPGYASGAGQANGTVSTVGNNGMKGNTGAQGGFGGAGGAGGAATAVDGFNSGAGGGGLTGNGGQNGAAGPGIAFVNGGFGGVGGGSGGAGGFGGGGGADWLSWTGGGGGGGYSGGGGGTYYGVGGGGGSYNGGTSQSNVGGVRSGNGQVVISWSASGCSASPRVPVTVTVVPIPAAPSPASASPTTICVGGTSQLNATSFGNTIQWYTVPSGGAPIGSSASGANFPVSPGGTTTYYAEAVTPGGGGPGTQTFNFTGGVQSFTVPSGVTTLNVDLRGAKGGDGYPVMSVGGNGGRMTSSIAVTPGQVLNIYVGGQGGNAVAGAGGAGGFNGGAVGGFYATNYSGGGGGGASDIRQSPYGVGNRLAVAGG